MLHWWVTTLVRTQAVMAPRLDDRKVFRMMTEVRLSLDRFGSNFSSGN